MFNIHSPLQAAFLALPLPEEAAAHFRDLQNRLTGFTHILRLQDAASPHLTLQYWPALMEIEVRQVLQQAAQIASRTRPFDLLIEGFEIFNQQGEDRVLYLAVPFSEPLARVKKLCPWSSGKPFFPHITLARISHPQRFQAMKKDILKKLHGASFTAHMDCLRLYGMVKNKRQIPLRDFPFNNQTP